MKMNSQEHKLYQNFNPVTETVTLTGQTKLTGSVLFRRVFESVVQTAGSGLANAGDIYVVKTGTGGTYTNGVPGTLTGGAVKVLAGQNFGLSGIWTCPAGYSYTLSGLALSARGQAGTVYLYHGYPNDNNLAYPSMKIDFTASGTPALQNIQAPLIVFNEKEDLFFNGLAATAGAIVGVEAILVQQ